MTHRHTCACGASWPCAAPIVANHDGIPERLCVLVYEGGELRCEECESLDGLCYDCLAAGERVDAAVQWDVPYKPYKLNLCDRHADKRQEAATEPDYDAVTLDEQMASADRLNREGRY